MHIQCAIDFQILSSFVSVKFDSNCLTTCSPHLKVRTLHKIIVRVTKKKNKQTISLIDRCCILLPVTEKAAPLNSIKIENWKR